MKNEIATKTTTELDTFAGNQDFDPADIEISRIGIAQAMSKLVAQDEKAQAGDIVNHSTGEVMATKDKSLDFLPLFSTKKWREEERVGNSYEFKGFVNFSPENSNAPYEFERNGTQWKRDLILSVYVLLVDELKKGFAIPHLLSFSRTSYKTGKSIVSGMAMDAMRKRPSAATVYTLKSKKVSNDHGTWFTADVMKKMDTPAEYLTIAKTWYDQIKPNLSKIKIDEQE